MKILKLKELTTLPQLPPTISFDLFDTLIERKNLSVSEVHDAVSGLILSAAKFRPSTSASDMTWTRYHTTEILKQSQAIDTEEPRTFDIWMSVLTSQLPLEIERTRIADLASRFEWELEFNNLVACPDAQSVLSQLKAKGHQLIAISDMYFSESEIRKILEHLALGKYFDHIFVSSTERKTKQTGNLFSAIREKLGHTEFIHIGDNQHSDYQVPKRLGISAIHLKKPHPTVGTNKWRKGADRLSLSIARLSTLFLARVYADAQRRGIEDVYFTGRDSTALLNIAESTEFKKYANLFFPCVRAHELSISRATTTWLSIDERQSEREQALQAISRAAHLLQGKICHAELNALLGEEIFDSTAPTVDLDLFIKRSINPTTIPRINLAWKTKKQQTIQYLTQVGLIENGSNMVVDVGYSGTSLRDINYYLIRKNAINRDNKGTHLVLSMMAEGPNAEHNRHLSRPYVEFCDNYVLKQAHIPRILTGNFSWFEYFFKDPSRGPLKSYSDLNGTLAPNYKINDVTTNPASELLGAFKELACEVPYWIACALSNRAHPLSKHLVSDLATASAHVTSQMLLPVSETDAASGELRSIILSNRSYSLRKLIKEANRQDYWMAGTLSRNGFGWFIPIYAPIKKAHAYAKRLRAGSLLRLYKIFG